MSIIEIKNDSLAVGIDTFGSELAYINGSGGTEFLWNGDPEVWCEKAPVLFPICGGLKNDKYIYEGKEYTLPKHGFAKRSEFCGTRISDTEAEFVLESSEETLAAYPFRFRLTINFALSGNRLTVTDTVENLSDKAMYFSIGSHEGFACPEGIEEYDIKFDEAQTLDSFCVDGNLLSDRTVNIIENSAVLPLKYEYFAEDALIFRGVSFRKVTLEKRGGGRKITEEFDKVPNCLFWTKPNGRYICIEPWNGLPDTVGSGYGLAEKADIERLDAKSARKFTHTMEFCE